MNILKVIAESKPRICAVPWDSIETARLGYNMLSIWKQQNYININPIRLRAKIDRLSGIFIGFFWLVMCILSFFPGKELEK